MPRGCSSTATTTCPGGCAPRATLALTKFDLSRRLDSGQTDIPRLREGGVKAQFWSVYIPSEHANPARTVTEQIDLVHRMVERYPDAFELAYTAEDVERIAGAGKIASLDRNRRGRGHREQPGPAPRLLHAGRAYMTLTHNTTLDWADAATDAAQARRPDPVWRTGRQGDEPAGNAGRYLACFSRHDGRRLARFEAPIIASHSSAFAICPSPRNVPDEILKP